MPNKEYAVQHSERHYGLDLLRIISMFMIVCLHINSHGGLLSVPHGGKDVYYFLAWVVNAVCITSVNLFVLLSGYFLIEQQFRFSRVLKLAMQVWFYSWVIGLAAALLRKFSFLSRDTIELLLPISYRQYWFVSAYIGLYFMSPVLNQLIHTLTKKQHFFIVISLIVLTSIWRGVIPFANPFVVGNGASLVWFVVLYFIAAYIRLYVREDEIKRPWVTFFVSTATMIVSMIVLGYISDRISFLKTLAETKGVSLGGYYFEHSSIFALISSIALFGAFLKIKNLPLALRKIIAVVAPLTFGVYLIHDNQHMRNIIWKEMFPMQNVARGILLPIKALGIVVAIFTVCIAVDFIRAKFFDLITSRKWFKKKMYKLDLYLGKIGERLFSRFGGNKT